MFISADCNVINKRAAIRKNRGGRRGQRSANNAIPLRTLRPIQEFWASLNLNVDLIFDLLRPLIPPFRSPPLTTSSHYDSIYIFVLPFTLISPLVHNQVSYKSSSPIPNPLVITLPTPGAGLPTYVLLIQFLRSRLVCPMCPERDAARYTYLLVVSTLVHHSYLSIVR